MLNLSRQNKIISKEILENYRFEVFGIGSVGSHLVNLLAKTGFKNIKVYDNDTVTDENVASQAYGFKHIGMTKVDALKDIVKESSGLEIDGEVIFIDENWSPSPTANTIYVCGFDSFEARKLLFDKLKDYPVWFIDSRIGRFEMSLYFVNLAKEEDKQSYLTSFPAGQGSELECGEKASAFINYDVTSREVGNIINLLMGKQYFVRYFGSAENHGGDLYIWSKQNEN